ncbi:TcaA 3rd/4th domain-containing protein [Priestia megaterium]|uniref:TcaA 3rd/4th domain-containing protein n=1 Tax=Priestia megaterium TaxID=1404 RepID=UPI002E2060A2|nr:YARHG domain-containing protein [Priestia megaterium]
MNQCPKCGASASTDQLFCNNCGFSFTVSPAAAKHKKSWYIGGGIALILLLTFVFYFFFSGSEEKTADRFVEALESKDTAVLRELLDSSQSNIVISDTSIQALLDATSDGSILRDVENDLKNKTSVYFTIKEQKHSLFFKKQYVVVPSPYYISLTTPEDATITVNHTKQSISKNQTQKIGPFMIGNYSLTAFYESSYGKLTDQTTVNFHQQKEENISLVFKGAYVTISSNRDDAILFINGKSTGLQVNSSSQIGPIATDGSVTVHAEVQKDGTTFKSSPYTIQSEENIVLNIQTPPVEKEKTVIKEREVIVPGPRSYATSSSFILPGSDSYKLSYSDISSLNSGELRLARNEIYARHGYVFKSKDLQAYFYGKSWYTPDSLFRDSYLSSVEKYNVDFIKSYE